MRAGGFPCAEYSGQDRGACARVSRPFSPIDRFGKLLIPPPVVETPDMESKEIRVLIHTPAALKSVSGDFFISYDHVKSHAFQWAQERGVRLVLGLAKNRTFPIDANRNEAVCLALKEGFTHVFFMDTDMTFPPDCLAKLLERELPIVSGIYCLKTPPYWPVMFRLSESDACRGASVSRQRDIVGSGRPHAWSWFKPIGLWPEDRLFTADMIGMGCCLIESKVFEALARGKGAEFFAYAPNPYSGNSIETADAGRIEPLIRNVTEDVHFWRRVRMETDFDVRIDPSVNCGHVKQDIIAPAMYRAMLPGFIASVAEAGDEALERFFNLFVDWKGNRVEQDEIRRINEALGRTGTDGETAGTPCRPQGGA